MTNPYNLIVNHDRLVDFRMLITKAQLFSVFSVLYEEYNDEDLVRRIIQFIVQCYSIECDVFTEGGNFQEEKRKIYRMVELPMSKDDLQIMNDVLNMENESVVCAIGNWLKYRDHNQLTYLKTLQDLYVQQQKGAVSQLTVNGKDGKIDYDQKQRCAQHMKELKNMIKDAEDALFQKSPILKVQVEEYNSVKGKSKRETLSVEAYAD